jgi:uncharacterized membrane protein
MTMRLHPRTALLLSLCGVSAYCTMLFLVRYWRTNTVRFGFLPWNLFLAWVPFICALIVGTLAERRNSWPAVTFFGIVWLLFLPNAPYLMTDLVHLGPVREAPFWFDVLLMCSFAVNGLLLGFASLAIVQQQVRRRFGATWSWVLALASLSLCGYGIYLGRFLRWNSWDALDSPGMLVRQLSTLSDPLSQPAAVIVSLLFGSFLVLCYFVTVATARALDDGR